MATAETLALSVDNNGGTYSLRLALARCVLVGAQDHAKALDDLAARVHGICAEQARIERVRFGTVHTPQQVKDAARLTAETLAEHLRDGA